MYCGSGSLNGKKALIFQDGNVIYAQFDEIKTGYGYGRWLFRASKFNKKVIL